MTSLKTSMACPYGQQKWRNTGSDSMCNANSYTGIIGSGCRPPLLRLDSTGEVQSGGFAAPQPTVTNSDVTRGQKSHVSVLRDWIVGKFVNTNISTGKNLAMSNSHFQVTFDSQAVNGPQLYSTVQQKRQFYQPPFQFGIQNKWQFKGPSLPFQPPRFGGDFRVFPCHRFEFFNNMKNIMEVPTIRPYTPRRCMGFKNGQHDQNFRSRGKNIHAHGRKMRRNECFDSDSVSDPQNGDITCKKSKDDVLCKNRCSSSQVYAVDNDPHDKTDNQLDEIKKVNTCKTWQPETDSQIPSDKKETKPCSSTCTDFVTKVDKMEVAPMNCTADVRNAAFDSSLDKSVNSLVTGVTGMKLDNVNVSTCKAEGKSQGMATSETAQVTDISDILLVRRNCKKGRPSAKKQRKRRRQKAKLSDSSTKTAEHCDIDNKNSQGCCMAQSCCKASSKCQNECCRKQFGCSTIAFILGLHSTPSNITDSFSEDDSGDDCCDFSDCDIVASIPQCNLNSVLPQKRQTRVSVCSPVSPGANNSRVTIDAINLAWNDQITKHVAAPTDSKESKKVRFNDEKLVTVHPMIVWSHAYQSCRKGPWEDYARDRQRFRRRINESEETLAPILDANHRARVYKHYHSI